MNESNIGLMLIFLAEPLNLLNAVDATLINLATLEHAIPNVANVADKASKPTAAPVHMLPIPAAANMDTTNAPMPTAIVVRETPSIARKPTANPRNATDRIPIDVAIVTIFVDATPNV